MNNHQKAYLASTKHTTMGFNISALVIDKNYSNHLSELEEILGEKLIFQKEVSVDEGCESWKEDDYCDIYYSETGTLVFLSMTTGGFDFHAENQVAFSFVLSETTGMYVINYVKNGELIRSYMETDEGVSENEGKPFDFEKEEDDKSELIYHLIEQTLGESFHEIDFEKTCLRYSFASEEEDESERILQAHQGRSANDVKPWWKFW